MARNFVAASSQYIEKASAIISSLPLTMACWFKSTDLSNDQSLMSIGQVVNADDSFALFAGGNTTGKPVKCQVDNGGTAANAVSSTGYSSGVWAHACGVFNSTTDRRAYINGGSKGTNGTSVTTPGTLSRTAIGRLTLSTPARYCNADIAEAAIWNVALDDAEILSLGKGISPLLIRPAALVAYWPLWGNDSPEPDRWKSRNDLTLNNTPTKSVSHYPLIRPAQRILGRHIIPTTSYSPGGGSFTFAAGTPELFPLNITPAGGHFVFAGGIGPGGTQSPNQSGPILGRKSSGNWATPTIVVTTS